MVVIYGTIAQDFSVSRSEGDEFYPGDFYRTLLANQGRKLSRDHPSNHRKP